MMCRSVHRPQEPGRMADTGVSSVLLERRELGVIRRNGLSALEKQTDADLPAFVEEQGGFMAEAPSTSTMDVGGLVAGILAAAEDVRAEALAEAEQIREAARRDQEQSSARPSSRPRHSGSARRQPTTHTTCAWRSTSAPPVQVRRLPAMVPGTAR